MKLVLLVLKSTYIKPNSSYYYFFEFVLDYEKVSNKPIYKASYLKELSGTQRFTS